MYCRYCGKENLNDSIFCEQCGKKLSKSQQPAKQQHRFRFPAREKDGSYAPAPKADSSGKQPGGKCRVLLIGAAVILCAALLAVLISNLEMGSLKTVTICVMDGKKTVSVNYTGESAGTQVTYYELFDIPEDGLPRARHSLTAGVERSEKNILYRYDHDGVVMDYLDYDKRHEELTRQERIQAGAVSDKIYEPLQSGEIDINEIDGYGLLGIEKSRVVAAFNYYGSDCLLKYDAKGNLTERMNFNNSPSEGLRNVITYSYTDDGKIREQKTTSFTGSPSYEFEYTYTSDNEIQVRQTTIQEGSDPVTVEYRNENIYDDNGLILKSDSITGDFVMMSREYSYHFVELEVPKNSVELLCSVYDYLGLEYVLEGEDVSVKQTMSNQERNTVWERFADWRKRNGV